MKTAALLLSVVVLSAIARAQEPMPAERAQKAARTVTESLPSTPEAPFKIDTDLEKPQGIEGGDVKLLVIPDKNLTAAALSAAGQDIVPVAQLWMHKAAIADHGKAIPGDKVRRITITTKDGDFPVSLFFVGVQKNDKGAIELVLCSKDKAPVLRVPLEKTESTPDMPVTLTGRKEGEDSGRLTLHIVGGHTAEVVLVKDPD